MKKIIITFIILCCFYSNSVFSQSKIKYKNHHLISNIELGSGNLYTFLVSSLIAQEINYCFLNDALFENSYIEGIYSTNVDGLKAKPMNPVGIRASELFNNIQAGYQIGYQTYNPEFFNCGIYASADYKLEQFKIGTKDDMQRHRAQRILVGATALVSLGAMEKPTKVIIEAGCRYSIGLSYKSPMSDDKSQLNNGFVSHFAVKLSGLWLLKDFGIFADINHFNLWKDYNPGQKLNNFTLGFSLKVTPQQVDESNRRLKDL